jgi:hypothetical protein
MQRVNRALRALVVAASCGLSYAAQGAPTVQFVVPVPGGALWGDVKGPPNCYVTGTDIVRVMFYLNDAWTNTDGTADNGFGCWIDTRKYPDGAYTLKAVAYDSAGRTATATRAIVIQNGGAPAVTSTAPVIRWHAPNPGGPLAGNIQGPPHCVNTGYNIARVMYYLNGVWTNTDGNLVNGLGCWIDTTRHANGSYTLRAVAYNSAGQTATIERSIVIDNPVPGPTVQWIAPSENGKLAGDIKGPPHCEVVGKNIARVMFYVNGVWTNTDGRLDNGLGCWIDTTKYKNGSYRFTAVAYDAAGRTATAERQVMISNNAPPTVAFTAPAQDATLSGIAACAANASDDVGVASVRFSLGASTVGTATSAPYTCSIDTTKFPNGNYTLTAVAADGEGLSATAERRVRVENLQRVAPEHILNWASGDVPFAQQSGYSGQVLGTWPSASSIPESGVHGTVLPNGETLRLGKVRDPENAARNALAFQIASSDPTTSGGKRSELSMRRAIAMDEVYWIAFRVYARDWGDESTPGLFGTQVHSGDNSRSLSPTFNVSMSGRNFRFHLNYSTSPDPQQSNKVAVRLAEYPIPFGRWADFVIKFRHNTSGNGLLQAWMDGKQIVDYRGHLGYNTPGFLDYAKFGVYKWTSFNTPRLVLLHSPIVVYDPTGSTYEPETLRRHVQ